VSASELYRRSDRRLSAKLVPTFAHVPRGQRPYDRIVGFLVRNRCFFRAALQFHSRGWVDLVPDPLLLRKSGSAGSEPGPVDSNSDHYTTEEVTQNTRVLIMLQAETEREETRWQCSVGNRQTRDLGKSSRQNVAQHWCVLFFITDDPLSSQRLSNVGTHDSERSTIAHVR
jgi:hypothetical protein